MELGENVKFIDGLLNMNSYIAETLGKHIQGTKNNQVYLEQIT